MIIRYNTTRRCDYDSRIEEEDLEDFVNRNANMGKLVELLVSAGVIDVSDVFEKFKSWEDVNLADG